MIHDEYHEWGLAGASMGARGGIWGLYFGIYDVFRTSV